MDRIVRRRDATMVAQCGTMASAGAAVVFGIMLAGFGGSAHFSQVDSYFLPTIAVALLANSRAETPDISVSRVLSTICWSC